jgi:tetratricopeptide (TPR) repeat protein
MRIRPLILFFLFACFYEPASAQESNLRAQSEVDQGVIQYQKAQYKSAARHLKKAVELNPASTPARLFLARTLTKQFDLNIQTPKNLAIATEAVEQFQEVLKHQPQDVESMNGLARLLVGLHKPDEARRYYQQVIAIDPNNVTAYVGIGMMDWTTVERKFIEARQKSAGRSTQSAIADPACSSLRAENLPLLDAALEELTRAFAVNKDDETVATYISMAYGMRADLECGDSKARQTDLLQIPVWNDRAQEARKKKPDQPQPFAPVSL